MKRKCIFLYVNQGFAIRYLLRTEIFSVLRNAPVDVVILSHNGDEAVFRESFEDQNVRVEKFEHDACDAYFKNSRLQRFFVNLRAYVLNGRYDTRTVDDFRAIYISQNGWTGEKGQSGMIKGLLWEWASRCLKYSRLMRYLLIGLESHLFCPRFHEGLFRKYNPDLVVVTALCGFKYNEYMAREARRMGVPVCCIVLSWDNTSGMGMPGCHVDHVIAWTEDMKRELVELNDIPEEKIFVGGVAHFDAYFEESIVLPKEEFFDRLGLDPDKKTIFLATKSPKRFPWGPELVAEIGSAIQKGIIRHDCQVLVRIHPLHYRTSEGKVMFGDIIDEYKRVAGVYQNIVLNVPETVSKKIDFDLSDSETRVVASILRHSDVMLNMFSTMAIEAAIFQLPMINVCIRDKWRGDIGKSRQDIMVDYRQTHNQRVVQTGGVETVFTMEELYKAVNRYLGNPELDQKERDLIRIQEAGPHQSYAGKVIGEHLLDLVGGVS